jgi:hypothetical protein
VILNLISGPRNVSTALMYSFAQRTDTHVLDEPFYAVFLAKTGVNHPGAQAVLEALPQDENTVRQQIATCSGKPVLFIKNMAHHMEVLKDPFIAEAKNIFLIRDPAQILRSYAAVISDPVMRDIGIVYQYELFCRLQDDGIEPVVIDSGHLLQDPISVLTKLCDLCGLEFEQRMAHWPRGPKPYDGIWAPYWYINVHGSTGFEKQSTRTRTLLPGHLNELYSVARSFYEKLLPFSLKA